ncbi:MAG: flagellar hook-length control protein FliK [Desulfitobacterium sp.]|nr:flagellar hook-length control protein FliK [Desulfitobacterium sp.]
MSGKIRVENQPQTQGQNPMTHESVGNNQNTDPQKMELAAQRLNSGLFLSLEGQVKESNVPNSQQGLNSGVGNIGLPQGTMNSGQEGTFQHQGGEGAFGGTSKENQSSLASQMNVGRENSFSNMAEESADKASVNGKTNSDETVKSFGKESFVDSALALSQGKEIGSVQGRAVERALPVWTQVANEIWEKAYQARPRLQELTIQLYPKELGEINISMRWEDGQLAMRMVATEASTGQLLQNNMGELRESLSQLGIQCGSMEMGEQGQEGFQEQSGEGMGGSHERDSNPSEILTLEDLEALLEEELDSETGSPRINVRA